MSITESQIETDFFRLVAEGQNGVKQAVKSISMKTNDFDGSRMRSLREDYGWTLTDLSNEIEKRGFEKISLSQLSLVETNERNPSIPLAIAIAVVLDASLDYLCGLIDYDKATSGMDEVTVVVQSPSERKLIQEIAYRFLDLTEDDQKTILTLVNRLCPNGRRTTRDRLRDAFATITEIAGVDMAALLPETFKANN